MERGILLCGVGIKLATEILEAAVYLIGLAARRTLEQCVLHEVGDAILAAKLIARACVYHQGAVRHAATHLSMYAPNSVGQYICFKLFHLKYLFTPPTPRHCDARYVSSDMLPYSSPYTP